MSKYVILNPTHGGTDKGNQGSRITESEYNLKIVQKISSILNADGIANDILRKGDETLSEDSRIRKIVNNSPNSKDTLVVTIGMDSPINQEIEIIYALRNTDQLSNRIATSLEDQGYTVSKYYQQRLPEDTTKDYNRIIRDTGKRESIIIDYGNLTKENFILENWESLAQITANAIATYLGEIGNFYTVQSGDNLYSIARKFGITVDELKRANNLGTNLLSIGQKLLIPERESLEESPSSEEYYIVQSGDTLFSIAQSYGISVEELKNANNLTTNILNIGQKLIIPKKESSNQMIYMVQAGDSLYSIATRYGITVVDLKKINNLNSNLLSIGQKLIIPVKSNSIFYMVQSGDNLYSIARKYNTTVEEIKRANGLTSNLLTIGQKLLIPNS